MSKYKQTVLGPAWAIIQPFFTTVVFSLIFGRIAGLGAAGVPRADAAALGLLMFGVILFWALVCGAVMLLGARRDAASE